jgi:hypothetical protein
VFVGVGKYFLSRTWEKSRWVAVPVAWELRSSTTAFGGAELFSFFRFATRPLKVAFPCCFDCPVEPAWKSRTAGQRRAFPGLGAKADSSCLASLARRNDKWFGEWLWYNLHCRFACELLFYRLVRRGIGVPAATVRVDDQSFCTGL